MSWWPNVVEIFVVLVIVFYLSRKHRDLNRRQFAMQRQLTGQNRQIDELSRAVAELDPVGLRPTQAQPPRAVGLTPLYNPTITEMAFSLTADAPGPFAVEPCMVGDRSGINPGDSIPNEDNVTSSHEVSSLASGCASRTPARWSAIFNELAALPLERPISSVKRTVEAFRREHGTEDTVVSAGTSKPR